MKNIIKNLFKVLSIPCASLPVVYATSCNTCEHEASDELVSLYANGREGAMYKCKKCGKPVYVNKTPTPQEIGMPIFNLIGDFTGMSKQTEIKGMSCEYKTVDGEKDFTSYCSAKWQGNTSLEYPKKNFNIKLFKDEACSEKNKMKLLDDNIKTNKYSFKANYFDSSNIRNLYIANVIRNVYMQEGITDCYSSAPYCGQITGHPVSFYCNGVYWGTYNITTKKDSDMFTTKSTYEVKGILAGEDYSASTKLHEHIASDLSNKWEFEYYDEEDPESQQRLIKSFNEFIDFINNTSVDEFASKIDEYSSKERLIDYVIILQAFALDDNWAKNILWVTYDEKKWFPYFYDFDLTLGINWYYLPVFPDAKFDMFKENALFEKIWKSCFNEIKTKYESFRQNALSNQTLCDLVDTHFNKNTSVSYTSNKERWTSAPYLGEESKADFIKSWITTRLDWLDKNFYEN